MFQSFFWISPSNFTVNYKSSFSHPDLFEQLFLLFASIIPLQITAQTVAFSYYWEKKNTFYDATLIDMSNSCIDYHLMAA